MERGAKDFIGEGETVTGLVRSGGRWRCGVLRIVLSFGKISLFFL